MSVFPCGRATACFLLVLLGVLSCLHVAASRPVPAAGLHRPPNGVSWRSFEHLRDVRRGSRVAGLADLKRYLARFGYMQPRPAHDHLHDDVFDDHMEAAVKRYQSSLSLPVTGRLDSSTLARIMTKRCGVADGAGMSVSLSASASAAAAGTGSRFTFLDDQPRWARPRPRVLTYAFSPTATVAGDYLPPEAVRAAFRSAFARWARVIPVVFVETDYGHGMPDPDIMVGFYEGDHGDGSPFDGRYGELAHASASDEGHIHFDAAEHWSVDVGSDTDYTGDPDSDPAMDLETVATHEIGHILGLGHSSSPEAIMYPYIDPMQRKVELSKDDIDGVLMLYGANPRFRHDQTREHPAPPAPRSVPSVSPGRSSWHAGSVSLVCTVLVMLLTLVK